MKRLMLLGMIAAIAICMPVFGQSKTDAPPAREPVKPRDAEKLEAARDKDVREVMTTVMMVQLSRELELNDEEAVIMVRRLQDARRAFNKRNRDRSQLEQDLRAALKEGADEDEVAQKLGKLADFDVETAQRRRDLIEKLGEGLSPKQMGTLYLFVQDFEGQMKRMIEEVRRARGRPPGPMTRPGGPPGPGGGGRYGGRGGYGASGRGGFGPGGGRPQVAPSDRDRRPPPPEQ